MISSDAFPQIKEVKAVHKAKDASAAADGDAAAEGDAAGAEESETNRVGSQVVESAQEDA